MHTATYNSLLQTSSYYHRPLAYPSPAAACFSPLYVFFCGYQRCMTLVKAV
jgi:hypothetical protein